MAEGLSGKKENLGSDPQHPHRSWAFTSTWCCGWSGVETGRSPELAVRVTQPLSGLASARVLVSETKQTTIEVTLWPPHAGIRAHGHKLAHLHVLMPVFIL